MAFRNGTIYIITYQSDYFEPQYSWVQLRRWKWGLIPDMESLGHAWGKHTFVYNKQTRVTGIVRDTGFVKLLVYTDDGKDSRKYEMREEYEDRFYYLSKECPEWTRTNYGYSCEQYEWMILQCEIDNITCIPLPMRYTGVEWDGELMLNETTDEIDFIVWRYSNTEEDLTILVYSYGITPRCHVNNCEILQQP